MRGRYGRGTDTPVTLDAFADFVRAEPLGVVATTGPDGPEAALVSARETGARIYVDRFPGSCVKADGFALVRVVPRWIRQYDVGTTPPTVIEGRPTWR